MAPIEVHFFHGFLGLPSDSENLSQALKPHGIKVVAHDFWRDLRSLSKPGFLQWQALKVTELKASSCELVLVGYSLGGRLLMGLPTQHLPRLQEVYFLASHPAWLTKEERAQRWLQDQKWAQRFLNEDWAQLMMDWQNQSVFSGDAPLARREGDFHRKNLALALTEFSVSRQIPWQGEPERSHWIYGDQDPIYSQWAQQIREKLPHQKITGLTGFGHRLPLQAAESIAKIILSDLEKQS
ncbi:MAG: alpha/beta fold hydrolase [Bdellovibrionales bacterium]|nr:alpha/beta fold hydrolase [Bdellovibrionales bacterium]